MRSAPAAGQLRHVEGPPGYASATSRRKPTRSRELVRLRGVGMVRMVLIFRWSTLLLIAALGCDLSRSGLELAEPDRVSAVEVRFGDHYCRRIEDPQAVAALASFLGRHGGGWQPFWGEPSSAAQVRATYLDDARVVANLGLEASQLVSRIGDRWVFLPLTSSEATQFLELLGGPPVAPPQSPCLTSEER